MNSTNSTRSTLIHFGALALIVFSAVALPGCGERWRRMRDKNKDITQTQEVNSGLNALVNDSTPVEPGTTPDEVDPFDETRLRVMESANLLEDYFAQAEQAATHVAEPTEEITPSPEPVAASEPEPTGPIDPPAVIETTDDGTGVRVSLAGATTNQGETADESAVEEPVDIAVEPINPSQGVDITTTIEPAVVDREIDPEIRKEQLVDELVGVLTELAQAADDPGAMALALTGLETLRPDTLNGLVEQGLLSEAEHASLDAVGEMLRSMVANSESGATIASPTQVSKMLEQIQRDLNAKVGLEITNAQLCTRVVGFGQFEPFKSNTFVAGRSHRAIVYVEVNRFAQRETTGNDGLPRFETKLSQRLELYHIADDLNTWNRKAETDTTLSRNRLRDYYLINQIELPPNLGTGKYNLKIVMRDLISDQVVEAIIPIEIVAG